MVAVAEYDYGFITGAIQTDNGDQAGKTAGVKIDLSALKILLKPTQSITTPVGLGKFDSRVKVIGVGQLLWFKHLVHSRFRYQAIPIAGDTISQQELGP